MIVSLVLRYIRSLPSVRVPSGQRTILRVSRFAPSDRILRIYGVDHLLRSWIGLGTT